MTLQDFIASFDKPGKVVLLEGKRTVPQTDEVKLIRLGKLLAECTQHMLFRSGNAQGADYFFSMGVSSVDVSRLQIIKPYTGHRNRKQPGGSVIHLDELNLAEEPEIIFQSKQHKPTEALIDSFVQGMRNRYTIKAAYIIRDTLKVIGAKKLQPASAGLFYDDLKNPMRGGTGHTMRTCLQNHIPVFNQETWMKWL